MQVSINHGYLELEAGRGWLFAKLGKREWTAEWRNGRWSVSRGVADGLDHDRAYVESVKARADATAHGRGTV
jgi:hypothetical protein